MPKSVIMPALGMAQETGLLLQWLKAPGQAVSQGEPLMEIETDKATVEIEAPASGTLAAVTAQPGDVVPVGTTIALILADGEQAPMTAPAAVSAAPLTASPVAARMAAEHNLSLDLIKPNGGRVEKQDVLDYLARQAPVSRAPASAAEAQHGRPGSAIKAVAVAERNRTGVPRKAPVPRPLASPKARRLARERGLDLAELSGSGPNGAVLAVDVLGASSVSRAGEGEVGGEGEVLAPSRLWQRMAERVTQAWQTIPHFYLQRAVNASPLAAWRVEAQARATEKITYTDLLVKLVAVALTRHPRLNATWQGGKLSAHATANIGLAVAVDDGLIVPVIHDAASVGLGQIAARRATLVAKAHAGMLALADLEGGTFTLSNLGMYGVDAFNAIVNPPQVAILAVGAVADRVVAVGGQPAVQPMLNLSLSCDHRAVDGARAALFLDELARLIAAPLGALD